MGEDSSAGCVHDDMKFATKAKSSAGASSGCAQDDRSLVSVGGSGGIPALGKTPTSVSVYFYMLAQSLRVRLV